MNAFRSPFLYPLLINVATQLPLNHPRHRSQAVQMVHILVTYPLKLAHHARLTPEARNHRYLTMDTHFATFQVKKEVNVLILVRQRYFGSLQAGLYLTRHWNTLAQKGRKR